MCMCAHVCTYVCMQCACLCMYHRMGILCMGISSNFDPHRHYVIIILHFC